MGLRMNKQNNKKIRFICPKCGGVLSFMMPDGSRLHCYKCNKYFLKENNSVGAETTSPYKDKNLLY